RLPTRQSQTLGRPPLHHVPDAGLARPFPPHPSEIVGENAGRRCPDHPESPLRPAPLRRQRGCRTVR
ncbi:hypothetical protein NGA_2067400, partial [Nannochloropsis gaditana CCMP526]|uniref:uncharacterized protein n=1 Tax=Nannochloropsis gaditana (strain CCMP526) TaxID=1093141 RepID=UPI00029F5931